jgi:uncharacterized alpha-E superfamily protein
VTAPADPVDLPALQRAARDFMDGVREADMTGETWEGVKGVYLLAERLVARVEAVEAERDTARRALERIAADGTYTSGVHRTIAREALAALAPAPPTEPPSHG